MNRSRFSAHDDRGAVIAIMALTIVVLMIFAAFAVDLGNHRQSKNKADSTADAAALAGAQGLLTTKNGKAVNGALNNASNKQGIADAATYAFNNLGLDISSVNPTKCNVYPDGGTITWCYNVGDTKNTVVQVSSPYVTSKLSPQGTTYNKNQLIHVDVCFDVDYSIASVIGVNKGRTCGHATGRGSVGVNQNTEGEDLLNDPLTKCAATASDIFDPGHYFPGDGKLGPDEDAGFTFLDNKDLDTSTLTFWLDGVAQNPATYSIAAKGPPKGYTYKYEVKWHTPKTGSPPPKLANGAHSVYVYAQNSDGSGCQTKAWTFYVGTQTVDKSTSPCQEDLFRGTQFPADGSIIDLSNGDVTIGAEYWDETPINGFINGSLEPTLKQWQPVFTVDDQDITNYNITFENPKQGGERNFKSRISWTVPANQYENGNHTFFLKAYDSDQNKKGGDCGVAKWTVNFTNGKKVIELVE